MKNQLIKKQYELSVEYYNCSDQIAELEAKRTAVRDELRVVSAQLNVLLSIEKAPGQTEQESSKPQEK